MRKAVLLAIVALIPLSSARAQIPTEERAALIALFNATNGAGWTNKSGWDLAVADTECTWFGVTCNGGFVQKLSLPSNNLDGSLPPELGNLTNLEELSLYSNKLGGSIPAELGNLSNLEKLWLMYNQLNGSIPPELGTITWLRDLGLYENEITGTIPQQLGDLTFLQNLYLNGNQLTGSIPPELGNLVSLQRMHLEDNQLTGSIPPELADPMIMWELYLSGNQLSGSIPPELGSSQLWTLNLHANQLTGSIPPELASMTTLRTLLLSSNRLSGSIPPELGALSKLEMLVLWGNRLSGDIPVELEDLSALLSLNIRFNALHSEVPSLITFLESKQTGGGDWQTEQTIAPANVNVDSVADHTIWLSWDAVTYQADPGGYEVFSSPTGSGIWTSGGWTESKATTTFPVTGLDPGTDYDFGVVTYTDPHYYNQNIVNSDFSTEVVDTTSSSGCAQPVIEKAGYGPFTLSLTGSYDSYVWSTGETTEAIDVDPSSEQWYWVTVASTGPCEETAATLVAPYTDLVFADGFESGGTTEWSSAVP